MNAQSAKATKPVKYTRGVSRSRLFYYGVSYVVAAGLILAMTSSFGSDLLVALLAVASIGLAVTTWLSARRYLSNRYVQLADRTLLVCSGRREPIRLDLPGDISSATLLNEMVVDVRWWRFWKHVVLIETTSGKTVILDSEQYRDGEDLISDVLVWLRAVGVEVRKA